jgi:endonuclease/exonuclease/phosphatase family metal-dependent hydrolase
MNQRAVLIGVVSLSVIAQACNDANLQSAVIRQTIDASAPVVIREVYGGGSNAAAVYTHDYVELVNRSSSPVSLAGWSIQYASATGTGNLGATSSQMTELPDVTLAPGQAFLIQEAGTGAVGVPLPSPDYVDPSPINLSATAGKVALVRSVTTLGCNGSSTPCTTEADALIVDLVGYGTANYFEGTSPAPSADNSHAIARPGTGCADTNVNSADFVTALPMPENGSNNAVDCTAGGGGSGGSGGSGGVIGTGGGTAGATGGSSGGTTEPGLIRIHDIQGRAHRSPLEGITVTNVPGIVTHVYASGFYFQDPVADDDVATSEGVLVYTSSRPTVVVGESVLVSGTVTEYRPGCSSCGPTSSSYANLTTTEIARPSVITLPASGQALPEAIILGQRGRLAPRTVIDDETTDVESPMAVFTPDTSAIDFYESLEGMRVEIPNPVAVGPTNDYGELPVLPDSGYGAELRTLRGGIVVTPGDFNPERVILSGADMPKVNVGDSFTEPVVAVVDYAYGNFLFYSTGPLPVVKDGGLVRETLTLGERAVNQLDIATLNVENLDPTDEASKFQAIAGIIANSLNSPDILTLEEVQDDSGPVNDGVVSASVTIERLVEAIGVAGGPRYESRSIDPVDKQDGGEPGGNIRLVFLFRTDRGLSFVERPGATATTSNAVVTDEGNRGLRFSPGRIEPENAAFANSRKPLAGQFSFNGNRLYVIANHFNSKGGDQPLFGRFQPPELKSEVQRLAQAAVVANFARSIASVELDANIVVLGDLNDYQFSAPVTALNDVGLNTLINTLPPSERYSYVYEGNSQSLDQILVSNGLFAARSGFDVVHVNSEFATNVSDHDPAVARFTVGPQPAAKVRPILECIEVQGRWSFVAHFGYDNPNRLVTHRPLGKNNRLVPSSTDRGQPVTFLPGRNKDVFTAATTFGVIAWQLDNYVLVATPWSPRCE